MRLALLALLLTGCIAGEGTDKPGDDTDETAGPDDTDVPDDTDTDDTGDTDPVEDDDGDGVANDDDCAPDDADVYPGAPERCNERDDDCDDAVDEDPVDAETFYVDADEDAWGGAPVEACERPAGAVLETGDCDDADPLAFPGAEEVCDGVDQDCDGTADDDAVDAPTWYADADRDGFGDDTSTTTSCDPPPDTSDRGGDCDDADATALPGGVEVCDGADDDCDGTIDEDAIDVLAWFTDADADGWGDLDTVVWDCALPEGAAADPGDCDDTDASVSPDANETCDDVDEDCDGAVDDDAIDADTWFVDGDTDGYGAPGTGTVSCDAPVGTVADATDCDDAVATVSPGARETCNEVDDDCDGAVDDSPTDAATWYPDADGDGYGPSGGGTISCDRPDGYGADAGDCDDADASISPGGREVCDDGTDQDCDGIDSADTDCAPEGAVALSSADIAWYGGSASAAFGDAVTGLGDIDGDGDDEVAVGWSRAGGTGYVYLFLGGSAYSGTTTAGASRSGAFVGDAAAGSALAGLGDFDGDGLRDLAIADRTRSRGTVYLVTSRDLVDDTILTGEADHTLTGAITGSAAGTSLGSPGDVDGDGLDDLLVGDPGDSAAHAAAGAAYLLLGGTTAASLDDADAVYTGEYASDAAGTVVAGAGDINGDGAPDLLLAAPSADHTTAGDGKVYVLYDTASTPLAWADVILYGTSASAGVGTALAGPGDVDGDGYADVLVGIPGDDTGGTDAGAVALLFGPLSSGRRPITSADVTLTGRTAGNGFGRAVAGAGDVDGDGRMDIVAGDPNVDATLANVGAAWLWYGAPTSGTTATADVTFTGTRASDGAGRVVAGIGDLDGDGFDDVTVASTTASASSTVTSTGYAWTILGGARTATVTIPATFDLADDADGDGLSEVAGDCDDTRLTTAPGLAETCGDGVDDDCDGVDDPCAPTGEVDADDAAARIYGGESGDDAGDAVVVGDFDCDGIDDLAIGDAGWDNGTGDVGAALIVYGPLGDGIVSDASADAIVTGAVDEDRIGRALAAGDTDGDGCDDLILGDSDATGGAAGSGRVYVVRGPISGTYSVSTVADLLLNGVAASDGAGTRVAAGDIDGDGRDEVIVGAPGVDVDNGAEGAVYVVDAEVSGTASLSTATARLLGETSDDAAGTAIALGDTDGDGLQDIFVGGPASTEGGGATVTTTAISGEVWLVLGRPTLAGDLSLYYADDWFAGYKDVADSDRIGASLATGDLNGDGLADLVTGTTTGGNTLVYLGPYAGTRHAAPDAVIEGYSTDRAGATVAVADLDQDGWGDVIVGVPDYDLGGTNAGAARVYYGPLSAYDWTSDAALHGDTSDTLATGIAVGDLDADGYPDLALGAGARTGFGGTVGGEVVVLRGGRSSDTGAVLGDDLDGDGLSAADGDCDDTREEVNPSATETCGNGLDDDCDGVATLCAPAGSERLEDASHARFESSVSYNAMETVAIGDFDDDGYDDVAFGEPRGGPGSSVGKVYLWRGPVSGSTWDYDEADVTLSGASAPDHFGQALDSAGDVDGDGVEDLVVGAYTGDSAYIFFGGAWPATWAATTADVTFTGDTYQFGEWTRGVGDVTGDGLDDIMVTSRYSDGPAATRTGAIYLFPGPFLAGASLGDSDAVASFNGTLYNENLQTHNVLGDLDGDGTQELVFGRPADTTGGYNAGAAHLYYGDAGAPWSGDHVVSGADVKLTGESSDRLGYWMYGLGDIDGDGADDFSLGSTYNATTTTYAGALYVYTAPPATGEATAAAEAELRLVGAAATDYFGGETKSADIDGDGWLDLVLSAVGLQDADGYDQGGVYVVYGPITETGVVLITTVSGATLIASGDDNQYAGGRLAVGDTDGDGYADFGVSSSSGEWGWLLLGGER